MKAIRLLLSVSFIYFAVSCINDIGNYDYSTKEDVIPITISGFNDTTAIAGNILEIVPEINNMDDKNRYVYLWYAAKAAANGVLPQRDTLSLERDLSAIIRMEPGLYNLVFEVRNPVLDVFVRKQVALNVTANNITTGWYILKSMNDETDFDYIPLDSTKVIPDILRNQAGYAVYHNGPVVVGDQQLQGKALKMVWQSQNYYHYAEKEDGSFVRLANQKALHIISEKELKTFNSNNLHLFKNFDEAFYEAPEKKPQGIVYFKQNLFFINSGKMHAIYGMSMNAGKFPYPKSYMPSPSYQLHPEMLVARDGAIVFDKVTRSFLQTTSAGATLNKIAEPSDIAFPSVTNMEFDLVHMIERVETARERTAYCLLKNVSNHKYYLAYIITSGSTAYPFISFREVPGQAKMPEADVLASPQYAGCVYFGTANVLSYYIDAPDIENNEKVIKTFPADETIAFIDNLKKEALHVLTNSPSGWKLYNFPIIGTTPDINPNPAVVYEGRGEGRYVMYRTF